MNEMRPQHHKTLCIAMLVVVFLVTLIPVRSAAQAQLPSGPFPNGLGVNDHNIHETLPVLEQMYSIGIRYLRIDLTWSAVETTEGVYNFSDYDPLVANAAQAGIKMIFILDYTNPLYDNGYSPDDSTGINAFVTYALRTVKHYQGKGIIWEIYNEPTEFWSTSGTTYTHWTDASTIGPLYYNLASATVTAIKSAYPDEIVVGPADASFDSLLQPNGANAYRFIDILLHDGLGNQLDAISVHPYRETNPETAPTDYTWLQGKIGHYTTTNRPIIDTEWGYTSCYYNNNPGCVSAGEGGTLTYTQAEIQKANYIVRAILTDVSSPVPIPIHMIYDWMDDGTDQGNPEDNYGLVQYYNTRQTNPTITPLPAYYAVQTLTSQLEGYTFVRRVFTNDNTNYILEFSNGVNRRYVCWNSSDNHNTVSIPIGSNVGVTVTSYDGNATGTVTIQDVTSGANGYSCAEQAYPQYIALAAPLAASSRAQHNGAPHLEKRGTATQLIVDGRPFLMLSGELDNSSSSSLQYMKPIWPKLGALGLNTVVTPLSWELLEPKEGGFDFTLVDGLIDQARKANERIVFLWFASWKNGMSSYAPAWVKADTQRFPRVIEYGHEVEILSTFGAATEQADARAFSALMRHIKQVDGDRHTVLMMQLENEVGILGDSRDHSRVADQAFASPVPEQLTAYLKAHYNQLYPDLRARWDALGDKTTGTWTEIFGDNERTDEIFMAWNYARYIQAVAKAGKAEYNIPMYVNTWLDDGTDPPGSYPSGIPQPWVIDVWRAAGSSIDIYSPDLYETDFEEWCQRYHRAGNPLYMPEAQGGATGAANVFYALGQEAGIGFSPYAIDDWTTDNAPLRESYHAIAEVMPLLIEHQSAGDVHGFVLGPNAVINGPKADFTVNGYTLHVTLDRSFGARTRSGYGMIMPLGKDEFLGVGKGFCVTFTPRAENGPHVGIAAIDEGTFQDGRWVAGRWLNGDEDYQGKCWRFDSQSVKIEKVRLYRFQ